MEELIWALFRYQDAKQEYDKAFDKYIEGGGYDWSYHGHDERESKYNAEKALESALNDYIDNRIEQKLKS